MRATLHHFRPLSYDVMSVQLYLTLIENVLMDTYGIQYNLNFESVEQVMVQSVSS